MARFYQQIDPCWTSTKGARPTRPKAEARPGSPTLAEVRPSTPRRLPEQELMKARLTLQIYRIVKARDLTQKEVGEIIGIPQPHVSALLRNRPGNFSVGRLLDFLTALGQDVEIKVKATRKKQGEMSLVVA